jgi:hypothetical protein
MAHFAKVENGVVTNVVVVDEHEDNGQEFLNSIGLDGTWIQTSYNGNIRGKYAGIGDVYNKTKDRFEPTKPFSSWVWNEVTYSYEAPVAYPTDGESYTWDEDTQTWVAQTEPTEAE